MFKIYGSSERSQFNTKDLLANFSCRDPLSELCLLVLTESKDRDWEVSLEIKFFRPFGPQLGLKIREGARLPWIRHTKMVYLVPTQYFLIQLINLFLKKFNKRKRVSSKKSVTIHRSIIIFACFVHFQSFSIALVNYLIKKF